MQWYYNISFEWNTAYHVGPLQFTNPEKLLRLLRAQTAKWGTLGDYRNSAPEGSYDERSSMIWKSGHTSCGKLWKMVVQIPWRFFRKCCSMFLDIEE